MKVIVTHTYPNDEGKRAAMLFDEVLVRKACKINGCDTETIQDCIENMREGLNDCTSCYVSLILDLDIEPCYSSNG